jgi:hypothetical protein
MVDALLESRRYEVLLANDQLRWAMAQGSAFPGFAEPDITFMPTYKFDRPSASPGYGRQSKRRSATSTLAASPVLEDVPLLELPPPLASPMSPLPLSTTDPPTPTSFRPLSPLAEGGGKGGSVLLPSPTSSSRGHGPPHAPSSFTYDSSPKQRVPSWTDRVLFKSRRPHTITPLVYTSLPIHGSDHQPVMGAFRLVHDMRQMSARNWATSGEDVWSLYTDGDLAGEEEEEELDGVLEGVGPELPGHGEDVAPSMCRLQ